MGKNGANDEIVGFKWQNGRLGIYMWSEVFTHDYANGDKIAIILIDTQGIFDRNTRIRDCTTIFALSMMLSSVQCYNLMNNIYEDDLQHLQMFMEYGRIVLNQTSDMKPFQYLLFTVRDWSHPEEIDYGWHGQEIVEEIFTKNVKQPHENRMLREQIASNFQEISAYLLPHPGFHVARNRNFNGNLTLIDAEFKYYVKELARSLLAPENLVIKTINGKRIRAREFSEYLQTYLNVFNGNSLPELKNHLTVRFGIFCPLSLDDSDVNYGIPEILLRFFFIPNMKNRQ